MEKMSLKEERRRKHQLKMKIKRARRRYGVLEKLARTYREDKALKEKAKHL